VLNGTCIVVCFAFILILISGGCEGSKKQHIKLLSCLLPSVCPCVLCRALISPATKQQFVFVVLPSSTCFFTAGVEGFDFSRYHTQTHTTVGRTPLDEGSARRRDLYLTTQIFTTDKHPCPRWDSNPQSQQALGRRPTP
jgi:hypothetical protein